jgi:hypothetical protein
MYHFASLQANHTAVTITPCVTETDDDVDDSNSGTTSSQADHHSHSVSSSRAHTSESINQSTHVLQQGEIDNSVTAAAVDNSCTFGRSDTDANTVSTTMCGATITEVIGGMPIYHI